MPCKCIANVFITVFRMPDSAEGREAQQFFARKGFAFDDRDVSTDPQALQKMKELSGQTDRPVILVDEHVFIGFDPARLDPLIPSFF